MNKKSIREVVGVYYLDFEAMKKLNIQGLATGLFLLLEDGTWLQGFSDSTVTPYGEITKDAIISHLNLNTKRNE